MVYAPACTCVFCSGVRTCVCLHCRRHRAKRSKAVRDTLKTLPKVILERIGVETSELNQNIVEAALDQARGVPVTGSPLRGQVNAFLAQYESNVQQLGLDPEIRWQNQEREQLIPGRTALFAHTFCEVSTKNPVFYSEGQKKFGVKYFVKTTLQGTIINVLGPYAAKTHDSRCTESAEMNESSPLNENDRWLADVQYIGANTRHVSLPFKKRIGRVLTNRQERFNLTLRSYAVRIEQTIACLKKRFPLFRHVKSSVRDMPKHGRLFKLACVAENILQQAANREQPKYSNCHNMPRTGIVYSQRGQSCGCDIFPQH